MIASALQCVTARSADVQRILQRGSYARARRGLRVIFGTVYTEIMRALVGVTAHACANLVRVTSHQIRRPNASRDATRSMRKGTAL